MLQMLRIEGTPERIARALTLLENEDGLRMEVRPVTPGDGLADVLDDMARAGAGLTAGQADAFDQWKAEKRNRMAAS